MKKFLFIFIILFSNQSFSEELVSKSASMKLRGLMTVVSMFNEIEEKMGESWGTAWALDGINSKQETCEPSIDTLKKEMKTHDEWKYIYYSLMMRGFCPEIQQDTDKAIKAIKELANNGLETAQRDLGYLYHKGSYGKIKNVVEPNLMLAIGYYKMAINQHNSAEAAIKYSRLLMASDAVMNDFELAYEILEKALQNGKSAFENENIYLAIYVNTIDFYNNEIKKIKAIKDEDLQNRRFIDLLDNQKYYDLALRYLDSGSFGGDTFAMALNADFLTHTIFNFRKPSRKELIHAYMWSNIALEVDHRESVRGIAMTARNFANENLSTKDILLAQELTRNWEFGSFDYLLIEE